MAFRRLLTIAFVLSSMAISALAGDGVGRFLVTNIGSANGSGWDGVQGNFVDPSTISSEADMAALSQCLLVETRSGRYYHWLATPTGATGPLTLDIAPTGDHTGRPSGPLATATMALAEIADGKAIVGSWTSRGITEAQKTELIKFNDAQAAGSVPLASAATDGLQSSTEFQTFALVSSNAVPVIVNYANGATQATTTVVGDNLYGLPTNLPNGRSMSIVHTKGASGDTLNYSTGGYVASPNLASAFAATAVGDKLTVEIQRVGSEYLVSPISVRGPPRFHSDDTVTIQTAALTAFIAECVANDVTGVLSGTCRAQNVVIPSNAKLHSDDFTLIVEDDGGNLAASSAGDGSFGIYTAGATTTGVTITGRLNIVSDAAGLANNGVVGAMLAGLEDSDIEHIHCENVALGVSFATAKRVRVGKITGQDIDGVQWSTRSGTAGSIINYASAEDISVGEVHCRGIHKAGIYLSVDGSGTQNRNLHIGQIDLECTTGIEAHGLAVRNVVGLTVDSVNVRQGLAAVRIHQEDGDTAAGYEVADVSISKVIAVAQEATGASLVSAINVFNSANEPILDSITFGQIHIREQTSFGLYIERGKVQVGHAHITGNTTTIREQVRLVGESHLSFDSIYLKELNTNAIETYGPSFLEGRSIMAAPCTDAGHLLIYLRDASCGCNIRSIEVTGTPDDATTHRWGVGLFAPNTLQENGRVYDIRGTYDFVSYAYRVAGEIFTQYRSGEEFLTLAEKLVAGKKVVLKKGETYTIDSAVVTTEDVHIEGNGATINCDVAGGIALRANANCIIRGTTFDGGNTTTSELLRLGGTDKDYAISNCTFKDVTSPTVGAYGIRIDLVEANKVEVSGCRFENIRGTANTTQGDSAGAPRGIYVGGGANLVSIKNCTFDRIRSVDGSDVPVYEDADAIQTQSTNVIHSVVISGCDFNDVGKRCIKLSSCEQSVIEKCTASSPWTNADEGMASFASVFEGDSTVRDCRVVGGNFLTFLDMAAEADSTLLVQRCHFEPDYQATVTGATTYWVRVGRGSMTIRDSVSKNTARGPHVYTTNPSSLLIENCDVTTTNNFVIAYSGNTVEVFDSTLTKTGGDVSTIVFHELDGFKKVVAENSTFTGFEYAHYIANQTNDDPGDWLVRMVGCDTSTINWPIRNNFGATKDNVFAHDNSNDSGVYAYIASNAIPQAPDRFRGEIARWNTSLANGASLIADPVNLRSGDSLYVEPTKNQSGDTLNFAGSGYIGASESEAAFASLPVGKKLLIRVTAVESNYLVSLVGGTSENVRYWGCKGDGVTDDTAAFQAACEANYGGRLWVPNGTYLISDRILIKQSLEIIGESRSAVIKHDPTATRFLPVLFQADAQAAIPHATVKNLTIDGSTKGQLDAGLLQLNGVSDFTVDGVYIHSGGVPAEATPSGVNGIGVAANGIGGAASSGRIVNSLFETCTKAAINWTTESVDGLISGNTVRNCVGNTITPGIQVNGGANCTIDGNKVHGCEGPGIICASAGTTPWTDSPRTILCNNHVYGNGTGSVDGEGIRIVSGNPLVPDAEYIIYGNYLFNNGTASALSNGLKIEKHANVTVYGNFIFGNSAHGILVNSAFNVHLYGNQIYNNYASGPVTEGAGIYVAHTTALADFEPDDILIENNKIWDDAGTQTWAIFFGTGGMKKASVRDNECEGFASDLRFGTYECPKELHVRHTHRFNISGDINKYFVDIIVPQDSAVANRVQAAMVSDDGAHYSHYDYSGLAQNVGTATPVSVGAFQENVKLSTSASNLISVDYFAPAKVAIKATGLSGVVTKWIIEQDTKVIYALAP